MKADWEKYLRLLRQVQRHPEIDPTVELLRGLAPYATMRALRRGLDQVYRGEPRTLWLIGCPPLRVQGAVHVLRVIKHRGLPKDEVFLEYMGCHRRRESFARAPGRDIIGLNQEILVQPELPCEEAQDVASNSWPDQLVWDEAVKVLLCSLNFPNDHPKSQQSHTCVAWLSQFWSEVFGEKSWRPPRHEEIDNWITQHAWESVLAGELFRRPWISVEFCGNCGGGLRGDGTCQVCNSDCLGYYTGIDEVFPLPPKLYHAMPHHLLDDGPERAWLAAYQKWVTQHSRQLLDAGEEEVVRLHRVIDLNS